MYIHCARSHQPSLPEYPEILWLSWDSTCMDGHKHTAPPCQSIPRSQDTLTILGQYMDGCMHTAPPCQSIPRSRDTLTIPGQYTDGHMHTAPPCQSISRSRDTLTIPDSTWITWMGTSTLHPPVRISWDPEILWPSALLPHVSQDTLIIFGQSNDDHGYSPHSHHAGIILKSLMHLH